MVLQSNFYKKIIKIRLQYFIPIIICHFIYTEEKNNDIKLKPWESWWEKNFDIRLQDFKCWVGNENVESRIKLRQYLLDKQYKSILDIPCGLGQDYFGFRRNSIDIEYIGIDITPKIVQCGLVLGFPIQQGSIESILYKDNFFDIVYSRHIFEHLDYYEDAVNEIIRVAKKEAILVFFIPPTEKPDAINLIEYDDGTSLFHNHYNKKSLEKFILTNSKVKKIEWENISFKEAALHIYLN